VSCLETVFLDRDGTINLKAPEGDYVKRVEEFELLPDAPAAMRLLTQHGVRIVVVTNQRGIALGRMTEEDLAQIHRLMMERLAGEGVEIAAIYHCPHDKGECDCRKPEIGMFLQARREHPEIDFSCSAVIGDSPSDMKAAERIGAAGVLISPHTADPMLPAPFSRAPSLLDAVHLLFSLYRGSHG
jgi:D-glycero-D-manno-heptose 1,7-bisphosphate phosphatase